MDIDVQQVVRQAAEVPGRQPVAAEPIVDRARAQRRRRRLAGATGLLLAVIAIGATSVGLGTGREEPVDPAAPPSVEVPPPGEVQPEVLGNGVPVWVVHRDGDVAVFDARIAGPAEVVGWCPQAEYFEGNHYVSQFDAQGRYVGGPAPRGLDRYDTTLDNGHLRLGNRRTGPTRDADAATAPTGPSCVDDLDEMVVHDLEDFTHIQSLQQWREHAGQRLVVIDAALHISPDGRRLCNQTATADPTRCDEPSLPVESRGPPPPNPQDDWPYMPAPRDDAEPALTRNLWLVGGNHDTITQLYALPHQQRQSTNIDP